MAEQQGKIQVSARNKIISVVVAVLVVVYGVSPADLVSDLIPIMGYIDDIAVAIAGIASIVNLLNARKMREVGEGEQDAMA